MSGYEPQPFSVAVEQIDGRRLVVVRGELDLATAPELEDAVLPPLHEGATILLDLRGLGFMDSTGVRVIVAAHHAAEEHGGRLALVRCPADGPVGRVLEISGLVDVLDIVDDVA